MLWILALCARYPARTLFGYWCAHAALFLVFSWRPFETFDGNWWRDLSAHALAGYTLLISLFIACRRPRSDAGWLRRHGEWFLAGRSPLRAVLFGLEESFLWELSEFVLDRVREYLPFYIAAAQDGWKDTLLDIAVALPTAVLAMYCIRWYERRARAKTREPVAAQAAD